MYKNNLLAFLIFLWAGTFNAHAATFTNSVVFDLTQATISSDGSGGELLFSNQNISLSSGFSPSAGDVLVTTVSFLPGQSLRITDGPNTLSPSTFPYFESFTIGFGDSSLSNPFSYGFSSATTTGSTFTGLSGTVLQTGGSVTGILGQSICSCGGFGDVTNTFFEFSSVTFTTNVNTVPAGLNLDTAGFLSGRAGDYTVMTSPSPVPLPASAVLLLSGFAATGLFARRRKKRPAGDLKTSTACATS